VTYLKKSKNLTPFMIYELCENIDNLLVLL
jgi:hypothetical protein